MAEQEKTVYCINSDCKKELQVKVKYCPFCGTKYIDAKLQAEQAEKAKQTATEAKNQIDLAAQAELERKKAEQERQKAKQVEKEQQEKEEKFQKEQEFKRQALEQEQAKREAEQREELARQQADLAYQKAELERRKAEQLQQANTAPPVFHPAQPKKNTSGKYIVIAFVIICIVIFAFFSESDEPVSDQAGAPADQETVCETAIIEIHKYLKVAHLARALNTIEMYQGECKAEQQFVELALYVKNQDKVAKEKFALAKEYLQQNDYAMAIESAQSVIDIDAEMVGIQEFIQKVELLQEQNSISEIAEAEEYPVFASVQQQDERGMLDMARQQVEQENLAKQKAELDRQRADLERQKAMEKAKQEALDRQKEEIAKRQETLTKQTVVTNQNDARTSTALVNADKALRMKNYGTAKKFAKEALAYSPNNAQAQRILRQAEEGEARAFEEMIIE